MRSAKICGLYCGLLYFLSVYSVAAVEFPQQLDPFLEKLFEVEECEDFLGDGEFTNVATVECAPFTCDFPRQICSRPADKYQDKSTNQCRTIPAACITAANGGVPLGPPRVPLVGPKTVQPPSNVFGLGGGAHGHRGRPGGRVVAPRIAGGQVGGGGAQVIAPPPPPVVDQSAICRMGAPSGRFCGFKVMYTYNRETIQCDEFWFPGCRTAETNANLFDDYQTCQKTADFCKSLLAPATAPPPTPRPLPPPTAPPPPPPPQPPPPPNAGGGFPGNFFGNGPLPGLGSGLGPGPGSTVDAGSLGPGQGQGGGDGDMGLFGFIKQGLMGAEAIKQGGPQGKQAFQATAGQILQQFTGFDVNNIANNFSGFFGGK